jgi:hypothetical protein
MIRREQRFVAQAAGHCVGQVEYPNSAGGPVVQLYFFVVFGVLLVRRPATDAAEKARQRQRQRLCQYVYVCVCVCDGVCVYVCVYVYVYV